MLFPLVTLAFGNTLNEVNTETTYNDQFLESRPVFPVSFYEAPEWTYTSCVEFAKWRTGHEGSWGWAGSIEPNIDKPEVGGFGLTWEGTGHMFVIIKIEGGWITTDEANLIAGERTSRLIEIEDPRIKGFLSRNWK